MSRIYKQPEPIIQGNFECYLRKHSFGPIGQELFSFETVHERQIHAEFMTHRVSRNASSSRAIPYEKMQEWIANDPALPLHAGMNRKGMQSGGLMEDAEAFKKRLAERYFDTVEWCNDLVSEFNPHKEIINRYTEAWGWIRVISTWTRPQLMNMYSLRISKYAHPNFQRLAVNMARLSRRSVPQNLQEGEWHTPYFDEYIPAGPITVFEVQKGLIWSTARCAWTSYNNPTKDATYEVAIKRHNDCVTLKHVTPVEHQKQARGDMGRNGGTAAGWNEYRHFIPGESATDFDYSILDTDYADRDYVTVED